MQNFQQAQQVVLGQAQINLLQNNVPQQKDTTFTKIFVGGLPYHTTDESLRSFFSKFGNIDEAVVIIDRTTGKSRGYGFVTMETKDAAEAAVLDPNPIIDGRRSNVNLAYLGVKPKVQMQTPAGFIPLTIARYPETTANPATFGLHPIYYQTTGIPGTANTLTTLPQTIQLAQPNLLLAASNGTSLFNSNLLPPTASSATTATRSSSTALGHTNSSALFDLTYSNTQLHNNNALLLNTASNNRTSPFQVQDSVVHQQSSTFSSNSAQNFNSAFLQLNAALSQSNNAAIQVGSNPVLISSLFPAHNTSSTNENAPNNPANQYQTQMQQQQQQQQNRMSL